jgi:zinc transport system permease protein
MAAFAAAFGSISALGGLGSAFILDTPAGPSIVAMAAALFALSAAASPLLRRG